MLKIRDWLLPLISIRLGSCEASIVTCLPLIVSSPLVSVIVRPFKLLSNAMVSPLIVVASVLRNDPLPESAVLVTVPDWSWVVEVVRQIARVKMGWGEFISYAKAIIFSALVSK